MNLADDFTATTYRSGTRNYQIHDPSPDGFGHGLMANVTTDGQMTFTIRANPELRAQYGSGGDMFDSLMLRLKSDSVAVNSIKGEGMLALIVSMRANSWLQGLPVSVQRMQHFLRGQAEWLRGTVS